MYISIPHWNKTCTRNYAEIKKWGIKNMRNEVDKSFKKSYWKDWIWKLARWYFVCTISEVKDKTKKICRRALNSRKKIFGYSYLKASITFNFAALLAGRIQNMIHVMVVMTNAIVTTFHVISAWNHISHQYLLINRAIQ